MTPQDRVTSECGLKNRRILPFTTRNHPRLLFGAARSKMIYVYADRTAESYSTVD